MSSVRFDPASTAHRAFETPLAVVLLVSLAMPLPFQPAKFGFTIFPFALAALLLAWLWLAESRRVTTTTWAQRVSVDPVLMAFVAVVFLMGTATVANGGGWRPFFLWVYLGILYAVAKYRLPTLVSTETVARTLSVLIIVMAVVCVVQYVTVSTFGALANYFPGGEAQNTTVLGVGLKRVQGPFFATNILAQWLAFATVWLLAANRLLRSRLVSVAIALSLGMVFFTFSRGSWIILPAACMLVLLVLARGDAAAKSRLVALGLAVVVTIVVAVQLAPSSWTERFRSDQGSVLQRSNALQAGFTVIHKFPWFGSGYTKFLQVAAQLGTPSELRPHDIAIQIWAEHGLMVLVAFVCLIGSMVVSLWRRSRIVLPERVLPLAMLVGVVTWLAFMLFYETAADYAVTPIIVLLVGFSAAGAPSPHAPSVESLPGRRLVEGRA